MLILTYGQPKSASTFLWDIARRASVLVGGEIAPLRNKFFGPSYEGSKQAWTGDLAPIADMAKRLAADEFLVLKTHSPLNTKLTQAIEAGLILPFLSYRHLGDSALSAFEAGQRARKEKNFRQGFHKLESHRRAIDSVGNHVLRTTVPWLKSGFGKIYSFEQLTRNPEGYVQELAKILNVDADRLLSDDYINGLVKGKQRVNNFNQGVPGRYKIEFSQEDQNYMNAQYGKFIQFCEGKISLNAL